MAKGLSEVGINSYCQMIKSAAIGCGIANDQLVLETTKIDKKISINFNLKDKTQIPCFKTAVNQVLPTMPITTKALFDQLLKQLDKKYPQ